MTFKIPAYDTKIKAFLDDLHHQLRHHVQQAIETQLETDVTNWLHRDYHQRRASVSRQTQARCQRCGSQRATDFMRNGRRKRQLVTTFGVLDFWLPRVVCACGGSVSVPFSILKPYQQLWDDVAQQIARWGALGLSLRQMQDEIGAQYAAQVGLRSLNQQVNHVESPTPIVLSRVPPVVMLDAIWVTLLADTDQTQIDRLKRHRRVKTGQKVCVLVALGLWPQSGRWGILGWHLAASESQAEWEALLVPLEARGLYRQRGLELLIHDGGSGLIAALNQLYPHIPHQRCAFHKLRNLWQAIQPPEGLSRQARTAYKQVILHEAQAILYARDEQAAGEQRDTLVATYQHTQPAFVATLLRDWDETIAFFRVLRRFPQWRRTALRTTSLLERVNRMLRRLFRPKAAFHSVSGLLATVARVLNPKRLI